MEIATVYQRTFKEILSRPVSAALTLGLFSSILFFQNRPLIFTDLSILIVSIPLIDLLMRVTRKESRIFLFTFAFLLILRFLEFIFPPEILFHRLVLVLVGIIELVILLKLYSFLSNLEVKSKWFNNFIRLLIILHIVAGAVVGIVTNIFGNVKLALLATNLAITNTFIGLLVIVSAVILIGLIQFAIDGVYLRKLNFIRRHGYYLKKKTVELVMFIAVLFWLDAILGVLGIRKVVYDFFRDILSSEFGLGEPTFTLGSILTFFFVIWLSVVISKIIRVVLEDDVLDNVKLKKGVPRMISVVARFTVITLGVFLAISAVGMPLDNLAIIFGAFSVGIGFGLQNIFNNLVSGVILLFERPIQINDAIEVGTLIGRVKSMGIRSSNIRTFDGAEVIVPNGLLISDSVVNWTLSDKRRRIEIISGVAYGSDVHKVRDLFLKVINEHPDVIKDPEPVVLFNDLGESSLDFRLLFWTDRYEDWIQIRSEIVFKIHDTLYAEGISIPFPQRDLHIKTIDGKVNVNPIEKSGIEAVDSTVDDNSPDKPESDK